MTTATLVALDSPARIIEAAENVLCRDGFANASTRRVARAAGVPLSQIHYHFGSKRGLMLGVLRHQNGRLIARQERMYQTDAPLWLQWQRACDHYDEDLASGYVRLLQEMIAAGWSDPEIAAEVSAMLDVWTGLLEQVAMRAAALVDYGPLSPQDVGRLVSAAWLGAEALHLLRPGDARFDLRSTLRNVGGMIRDAEERRAS